MPQMKKIKEISLSKDEKHARIVFGPHYAVNIDESGGKVSFSLVATHHGFKADASEVGGELEKFIGLVCKNYPDNCIGNSDFTRERKLAIKKRAESKNPAFTKAFDRSVNEYTDRLIARLNKKHPGLIK